MVQGTILNPYTQTLGVSGRLRPQNVTIWDDPGNGEPAEICQGKVHIGVLEDVTEDHEQYDVDPAHFGLKLSRSHSEAVRPFEGVSKPLPCEHGRG